MRVHATREAVLSAIQEHDALGAEAFLTKYNYRESKLYVLVHNGRQYASKAILGVAAGVAARVFSGGAEHTVHELRRLGFRVVKVVSEVAKRFLSVFPLVAWSFAPLPSVPAQLSAAFFSGVNYVGEVDALHALEQDIGITATNCPESLVELLLERLPGSRAQLFIDSGAFSEVDRRDVFKVARPITDDDWRARLSLYRRFAERLGNQVHVVAPDRVANQDITLERMAKWSSQMRELADLGAVVLAPVQKGQRSQADFYRAACDALGFEAVPAMPCMKAATTPDELRAFCAEVRPSRIHLLGIGPANRQLPEYLAAVHESCPDCQVQVDSARFPAHTGTGGNTGRMRRITAGIRVFDDYARDPRERKALAIIATFAPESLWREADAQAFADAA